MHNCIVIHANAAVQICTSPHCKYLSNNHLIDRQRHKRRSWHINPDGGACRTYKTIQDAGRDGQEGLLTGTDACKHTQHPKASPHLG